MTQQRQYNDSKHAIITGKGYADGAQLWHPNLVQIATGIHRWTCCSGRVIAHSSEEKHNKPKRLNFSVSVKVKTCLSKEKHENHCSTKILERR